VSGDTEGGGVLICSSEATSDCLRRNEILESNPGQQLILTHWLLRGASDSPEGHNWRGQAKESECKKPPRQRGVDFQIERSQPEGSNGK
jgi:hypothetical protein